MVVIVIGSHLFGLWGVIVGPLVAAVAKEVIKYFVDQWNRPVLPLGPLEDIEVTDEPASVDEARDGRRRTGNEHLH
jgi:hypothetical protein